MKAIIKNGVVNKDIQYLTFEVLAKSGKQQIFSCTMVCEDSGI